MRSLVEELEHYAEHRSTPHPTAAVLRRAAERLAELEEKVQTYEEAAKSGFTSALMGAAARGSELKAGAEILGRPVVYVRLAASDGGDE